MKSDLAGHASAKWNEQKRASVSRRKFYIQVSIWSLIIGVLVSVQGVDWWKKRTAQKETVRQLAMPPLYGGYWSDDVDVPIIRTMCKNGSCQGCGSIKWKIDLNHPGRALVRCSRDGIVWREYVVDEKANTVRGPTEPTREND